MLLRLASKRACITSVTCVLGFALIACASQDGAPAESAEEAASFTRTVVQRRDDGTQTVTAYRVTHAAGGEKITALGNVVKTADGTHSLVPLDCPGCGQGNGTCGDFDLRIWDNTGVSCGPEGCFRGSAYSGNELCFTGGGVDFSFPSYCRVYNWWFGCADTWLNNVNSFQTGAWNACFRFRWDVGYPYPAWSGIPSTSGNTQSLFETKRSYGVSLTSYSDSSCTH